MCQLIYLIRLKRGRVDLFGAHRLRVFGFKREDYPALKVLKQLQLRANSLDGLARLREVFYHLVTLVWH